MPRTFSSPSMGYPSGWPIRFPMTACSAWLIVTGLPSLTPPTLTWPCGRVYRLPVWIALSAERPVTPGWRCSSRSRRASCESPNFEGWQAEAPRPTLQCVLTPKPALRAAIIGCGLIGRKRAASLPVGTVAVCCDTQPERATQLALATPGAAPSTDWRASVRRPDVDVVFIATTHDQLAPIAADAAAAAKHRPPRS